MVVFPAPEGLDITYIRPRRLISVINPVPISSSRRDPGFCREGSGYYKAPYKSFQPGFAFSINSIFQARFHSFMHFSR